MKIIYLGTPEFAVKPLLSLIKSRHEVVAVVTQPDRPIGRKKIITPPPVKVVAEEYGVPVYQFDKIRYEGVEILKSLNADAMVTCAYGQILSQEVLDVCPLGVYNVHASLLPKLRGAAPIQFAIINGETQTGITFMKTDVGLDTGDIIEQYPIDIMPCETFGSLSERLSVLAAEKIADTMTKIELKQVAFKKQDDALSSVVKTIKNEDCIIDFTKNCETVKNLINGLSPIPSAYTFLGGKRYKFLKADISDMSGEAGKVLAADKSLVIACAKGAVEILSLQEEGGKAMDAKAYLLGRKLKVGDVFKA